MQLRRSTVLGSRSVRIGQVGLAEGRDCWQGPGKPLGAFQTSSPAGPDDGVTRQTRMPPSPSSPERPRPGGRAGSPHSLATTLAHPARLRPHCARSPLLLKCHRKQLLQCAPGPLCTQQVLRRPGSGQALSSLCTCLSASVYNGHCAIPSPTLHAIPCASGAASTILVYLKSAIIESSVID
jgi:hypothetical protein